MADATGLREAARTRYSAVFDEACRVMALALMDAAPLGETGDTRRGCSVEPEVPTATSFGATAKSATPQGEWVEDGTPGHMIFPLQAKALRWQAGQNRISTPSPNQRIATRSGGVAFAKYVFHPPVPPRPWFGPTVERWPDFVAQAAAGL